MGGTSVGVGVSGTSVGVGVGGASVGVGVGGTSVGVGVIAEFSLLDAGKPPPAVLSGPSRPCMTWRPSDPVLLAILAAQEGMSG